MQQTQQPPNKQEIEEFQEFIEDMVKGNQIQQEDISEENAPKLFEAYKKLKNQGKWKSKKQQKQFMKDGGVLERHFNAMERINKWKK